VSETSDKRRRSDLDLFVLALVEGGVSTPYELKQAASLSPGATIPTLGRLLESGLVTVKESGPRGRTVYKITAESGRRLKSGWKNLINLGPSGDLDADLRVALLALWVGGDWRLAADFLRQAAALKIESVDTGMETSEQASFPLIAFWYRRLRSASAEALLKGQSAAALAMAKSLPRKRSGRAKQSTSKPKS
jgi:DNA-binding PadR family transcriptional regulator